MAVDNYPLATLHFDISIRLC